MFKRFLYFTLFIFIILTNNLGIAEENEKKIILEVGKPYKIKGKWYYPKNNLNYSEIGIASINSKKREKKTKNGEIFSNDKIYAKHKTLALPTIVRVTNLKNGYSINVRINDRGPKNIFRIIELSKKTANYLKIKDKALVEVRVIPDLTIYEQSKIKGKNFNENNIDNLEKDIALGKEEVETENLMVSKNEKAGKEEKEISINNGKEKKSLKYNFRRSKIPPYYLRIEIAKFKKFKDASNLKKKMKPIYDKILISLSLLNGRKYYKVTTVPISNLNEAEHFLNIIHKTGFNNAKLFIENKKK